MASWAGLVLVAAILMTIYYNTYLNMLTYLIGAVSIATIQLGLSTANSILVLQFFSYLATSLYACDGIMRFSKWRRNTE